MNIEPSRRAMRQAPSLAGPHEGYMPGFGNDFETEALPGALPRAGTARRNALTAFTANNFPAPPSPRRAIRTSAPGAIASALGQAFGPL